MPSEDLKIVKKEKVEEEEDSKKSLGSTKPTKVRNANGKVQPNNAKVKKEEPEAGDYPKQTNAATSGSRYKAAGVKKERNEDSEDDDDKPLCKRSSFVKLHKVSSTMATDLGEMELLKSKKQEENKKGKPAAEQRKKVYDLPGQKRDPPEERDPIGIFYETLYLQLPNSERAQIYLEIHAFDECHCKMMESGLLSEDEAKKVFEKKQKKNHQQKLTSLVKAVTAVKSSTRSVTVKKKAPSFPAPSIKKSC